MNHKILVCFADQGSGFCITGKIEAGYIQTGDRLQAMPPNETCTVKGIYLQDAFAKQALSWDGRFLKSSLVTTPK